MRCEAPVCRHPKVSAAGPPAYVVKLTSSKEHGLAERYSEVEQTYLGNTLDEDGKTVDPRSVQGLQFCCTKRNSGFGYSFRMHLDTPLSKAATGVRPYSPANSG